MSITLLQIQNLRNIKSAKLHFHPHLNVIIGNNGSGKTSLLEAIYLLGSGHSFRTREISPLINYTEDCLTVFARMDDEQTISIQKSAYKPTQVRLNSYPCLSSSELAYFLPCQIFYQNLFQIIDAGPTVRRNLLDWGLFHVKQNYLSLWKDYKRALKQRNSLLKQSKNQQQLHPWHLILDDLANQLDALRMDYFEQLDYEFQQILPQLTNLECSLFYYKGWDRKNSGKPLATILAENYASDCLRQFTQYGAHQADLIVQTNELKAKQYLSRGQQKIILFALKLAQARLVAKPCVFLCDDMPSELDEDHLSRLLNFISRMNGQFFITAINFTSLPDQINDMSFTVHTMHHGAIIP
ncbi:DNA replication/repair protein RecF [Legionella fairfieldensis]|uniref:DNA replication/repair protein RecF n=1 Tax=Legionella fairfieldensis TaxID=45064 RepID=UPI0004913BBF|nr:DNA replication/repair protein RecF [Legionella fairfieldensis]